MDRVKQREMAVEEQHWKGVADQDSAKEIWTLSLVEGCNVLPESMQEHQA